MKRYLITAHNYIIDTKTTKIDIIYQDTDCKVVSFNHRLILGDGNSHVSKITDVVVKETDKLEDKN